MAIAGVVCDQQAHVAGAMLEPHVAHRIVGGHQARIVAEGVRQAEHLVLGGREVAADADGDAELVVVLER